MEINRHIFSVIKGFLIVTVIGLLSAYINSFIPYEGSSSTENINGTITDNYIRIVLPLLLSPILEEVIFRRWLPNVFEDILGRKKSIVLSNILFSFFHFDIFFIPYLCNGLVYAYFYEKTKSIKVPILIHILYNLNVFLLTFIWF